MVPLTPSSVSSSASTSRDTSFQADLRPDLHSTHGPCVTQDDDALAQQRLDKFVELVYDRLNIRAHLVPSLAERLEAIEICLGIDSADDKLAHSNGTSRKQRNHLTEVRDRSRLTAALFSTISGLTARLDEVETALEASASANVVLEAQINQLGCAVSFNTFLAQQCANTPPPSKASDIEPTITMLALQQALESLQAQAQQYEALSKVSEGVWAEKDSKYEARLGQVKRSKFHLSLLHASPREPLPRCPPLWPYSHSEEKDTVTTQDDRNTVENTAPSIDPKLVPEIAAESTAVDLPSSQPPSSDLSDPSSIYTPPLRSVGLKDGSQVQDEITAEAPLQPEQPLQAPLSPRVAEATDSTQSAITARVTPTKDDSGVSLSLPDVRQPEIASASTPIPTALASSRVAGQSNKDPDLQAGSSRPLPLPLDSEVTKPQRRVSFELTSGAKEPRVSGPSDASRKLVGVLKGTHKVPSRRPASSTPTYPSWLLNTNTYQTTISSAYEKAQPASASVPTNSGQRRIKVLPPKLPSALHTPTPSGAGPGAKSSEAPLAPVSGKSADSGVNSAAFKPVNKNISYTTASSTSVGEKSNKESAAAGPSKQAPSEGKKRRREEEHTSKDARQQPEHAASSASAKPGVVDTSKTAKKTRKKNRMKECRETKGVIGQAPGASASRGRSEADTWWELPLSQSSPASQSSRRASGVSAPKSAAEAKDKGGDVTNEQAGSGSGRDTRDSDFDLWGSAAGSSSPCPQRTDND